MSKGEAAMEKTIDVLTFGDLCADLILSGKDVVPEFGQKEKLIDDYSLEMGGSCSIFACQTSKLGLRTTVVGKLGDDQFGELIFNTLNAAGTDTSNIKKGNGLKTGLSVALSSEDDRAILTYNGTIDSVDIEDIMELPADLLKSVRHLHIGSYYLMKKIKNYYPEIIKRIKSHDATVSLDTNWDPEGKWAEGLWEILPYIDIFLPNENEAMAIAGESNLDKAIEKFKKYIPIIAVKKGKDGAIVYTKNHIYSVPSISVAKVDAIGAGDSFDGGFIYGFLSNKSIEECAQLGCICGSLNTRRFGGTKGQPLLEEALAYQRSNFGNSGN